MTTTDEEMVDSTAQHTLTFEGDISALHDIVYRFTRMVQSFSEAGYAETRDDSSHTLRFVRRLDWFLEAVEEDDTSYTCISSSETIDKFHQFSNYLWSNLCSDTLKFSLTLSPRDRSRIHLTLTRGFVEVENGQLMRVPYEGKCREYSTRFTRCCEAISYFFPDERVGSRLRYWAYDDGDITLSFESHPDALLIGLSAALQSPPAWYRFVEPLAPTQYHEITLERGVNGWNHRDALINDGETTLTPP